MQEADIERCVDVEGFSLTVTAHAESLVDDPDLRHYLIDHYLALTIACTGTNVRFGDEGSVTFLITQFAGNDVVEVESESGDPIMVLTTTQQLRAVRICEIKDNTASAAALILTIKNDGDQGTHSCVWVLRRARTPRLH